MDVDAIEFVILEDDGRGHRIVQFTIHYLDGHISEGVQELHSNVFRLHFRDEESEEDHARQN